MKEKVGRKPKAAKAVASSTPRVARRRKRGRRTSRAGGSAMFVADRLLSQQILQSTKKARKRPRLQNGKELTNA